MEKRIFLSYTNDERELAEKVRNIFNIAFQGQIEFFFFSTDIKSGAEWKQAVKDAIRDCEAIMLILTPKYADKPWSLIEWSAFWANDRTAYFLTTDDLQHSKLVSPMQDVQATNMFDKGKVKILFETLANRAGIEYFDYKKADDLSKQTKEIYYKLKENELKSNKKFLEIIEEFPLLKSINSNGLVSIENRNNNSNVLPPEEFYKLAKNEIFMFAISAKNTFTLNYELIKDLLDKGIVFNVLILNPLSSAVEIFNQKEVPNIKEEILHAINIIKYQNFDKYDNFNLRFFDFQPSYLSVMIDGDINHKSSDFLVNANDFNGNIRIQPLLANKTAHKGVVLQFKKIHNSNDSAFDYFVSDLRKIWQNSKETID